MVKTWKNKNLAERPTSRAMVALALAASLAAFGCTTNRTPGNGEPVGVVRPGVGPAPPTSGVTGSSTGTTSSYQPMFSSSTYVEALPTVNARAQRLPLSPDEAAAIMADNQLTRGARVLGPSSPGVGMQAGSSVAIATGQFQNPAMQLSPIVTVNSSINSAAHVPAISEGAGGSGGGTTGAIVAGTNVGVVSSNATVGTVTGATSGTVGTTAASPAAAVFAPSTAGVTPTTAALPFSAGSFAAGTVNPTLSSAAVPATTVTTTSAGTAATTATNATTTATSRPVTAAASRANSTTVGTASGTVTNPVRVNTDANGKVTITNTATGTRQQQ